MKREVELMKQIEYTEGTTGMKLDRIVNHDCIVFKRDEVFKGCPYVILKAGTRALHSGIYDLNESELNRLIEERK